MARITFSIPEELAAAAESIANGEKRSLSSYITLLVERDLDTRNALPGSPSQRALIKARAALEAVGPEAFEAAVEDLLAAAAATKSEAEVPS